MQEKHPHKEKERVPHAPLISPPPVAPASNPQARTAHEPPTTFFSDSHLQNLIESKSIKTVNTINRQLSEQLAVSLKESANKLQELEEKIAEITCTVDVLEAVSNQINRLNIDTLKHNEPIKK